jgi:hypothetical protein
VITPVIIGSAPLVLSNFEDGAGLDELITPVITPNRSAPTSEQSLHHPSGGKLFAGSKAFSVVRREPGMS